MSGLNDACCRLSKVRRATDRPNFGWPGTRTKYVYDQAGHLLGEYSGTGTLIQETVWLGDIPVATLRPSGTSVAIYYVETNQLDTPDAVIVPSNNAFRWDWYTNPFGNAGPAIDPQNLGNFTYDLRYPGQIAGAWGNTFQNDNRDYDPYVGGYVESDPIGQLIYFNLSNIPGVTVEHGGYWNHLYAYADDNPLSRKDPTGLGVAAWWDWILDLFKEKVPEEFPNKTLGSGLAAVCITRDCGLTRDSLELYADCASILGEMMQKVSGRAAVGAAGGLGGDAAEAALDECSKLCAEGIKTGACCNRSGK